MNTKYLIATQNKKYNQPQTSEQLRDSERERE